MEKPTIYDLEKLMENGEKVEIKPDGEVVEYIQITREQWDGVVERLERLEELLGE